MLSKRNELIAVGALVLYLVFVPSVQFVREILATGVGKAAALSSIVYVQKYVSCSVALLLAIAYVRCARTSWEGFTTPTATVTPVGTQCPDGYAFDSVANTCKASSSMSGSVPPSAVEPGVGASVTAPPPNAKLSTAPMTTPTATMGPVNPPNVSGGVQPSGGSSSSVAHV